MHRRLRVVCLGVTALASTPAIAQYSSSWPSVQEYGGATPLNQNKWVGPDDYPTEAMRKGLQGNVVVAFDITPDGKATNCTVNVSSGVAMLDRVPCKLIERRARFKPALDKNGAPISTKGRSSAAFWMPK